MVFKIYDKIIMMQHIGLKKQFLVEQGYDGAVAMNGQLTFITF